MTGVIEIVERDTTCQRRAVFILYIGVKNLDGSKRIIGSKISLN